MGRKVTKRTNKDTFTFIDLFCGIGGFNQGVHRVFEDKGKCIFAADNDENVADVYKETYKIDAKYDLTDKDTHKMIKQRVDDNGGTLDLLCAGFPCQSFSKAGNRDGFLNQTKGTLFFQVASIIKDVKPKYVLLENVKNLRNHDNHRTWDVIVETLNKLGYDVDYALVSPNCFGIPTLRERIFIMCYRNDLKTNKEQFFNGKKLEKKSTSIYNKNGKLDAKYFSQKASSDLEKERIEAINVWEDLNKRLRKAGKRMYSPMWTKYYFNYRGSISNEPEWKQILINKNKLFYRDNKKLIDQWRNDNLKTWEKMNSTEKKFEWNANTSINSVWDGIIQFRPSGIRLKSPEFLPTFVAINQTPIIGSEKRYVLPSEMAKLYGFKNVKFKKDKPNQTYKQLGNTVCVQAVEYILNQMLLISGGNSND